MSVLSSVLRPVLQPVLGSVFDASAGAGQAILLPKWNAALQRVQSGNGPAKVMFLGDSTTTGSGALGGSGYNANGRPNNAVAKSAAFLSGAYPTRDDSIIGCGNVSNYQVFDPRFSLTGWSAVGTAISTIGRSFNSVTDGAVMSFTSPDPWDSAEIWFARTGSAGNFSVNVDGGLPTAVTGAGANAYASVVVSANLGQHVLNIVKSGTARIHILAIRLWNSANPQVEVIQAGHSGAVAATFSDAASPWSPANQIKAHAPDLCVIDVTINDWSAPTALATYRSNLQAVIDAAKVAGDVLLASGVPSAISVASIALQQQYVDEMISLASENGIAFVDVWRDFGSYESNTALYSDTKHPNGDGYTRQASVINSGLL